MPPRHPKKIADETTIAPQGLSSKILGLFKKIPMAISSPTKETGPSEKFEELELDGSDGSDGMDEGEEEEMESDDMRQDDGEEEEDEEEEEDDVEGEGQGETAEEHVENEEEEEEEEEEDNMGHGQYQAIMDNYLLETSTRTNLLRTRIRTQFRPALRRRFAFELSRLTPSIAHVTARDYHERDGGVLRNTMEFVARLAVEQKGYQLGMKRTQSTDEMGMSEMEKTFRKRKRLFTNNSQSTSTTSLHPNPPRSLQNSDSGTFESSSKRQSRTIKPRPARRDESLMSVNGSPVTSHLSNSEFTFVSKTKWMEFEREVKERLNINEHDKQKLNEMLMSLKMDIV